MSASSLRRRLLAAAAATAVLATLPMGGASAAVREPSLELIAPRNEIKVFRFKGEPTYLDLGTYIAAMGGTFEIKLTRPDYAQPVVVQQILHGDAGETEIRDLPGDVIDGMGSGLLDFFEIRIDDVDGNEAVSTSSNFCPNGWSRERVNDDGPDRSAYPEGCFANPFTRGMVWGIDENWAALPFGYNPLVVELGRGRYQATISVAERYIDLFGIDPARATGTVAIRVKRYRDDCYDCEEHRGVARRATSGTQAVPTMDDPDQSLLPDLIALPAWGISVENRRKRTFLNFGATVWTGGAASLVVEGFRRAEEDVMDAYQYFYENGKPIGRSEVGELEYDPRKGHNHWHFLQFAGYSLLSGDQEHIVKSKKEAFCLAPTDAIDLALDGADWNPGEIGLHTACGSPNSIWVREILPLGWGDTYFQGLPGQSFNITNLPNGTYYIEVEANPSGFLHEQNDANNVELREITIKGKPGNRRVEVPPWNGIDTEGGAGGKYGAH